MVHIGQLIKKKIEEKGLMIKWVAAQMPMSRNNLYVIFEKESIDTSLLKRFSQIIGYDFFQNLATDKAEEPRPIYEKSPKIFIKIVGDDEEVVDDDFMNALNEFFEEEYQKRKRKK